MEQLAGGKLANDYAALCADAGLKVLAVATVGKQTRVTVAKAASSASGLAALTKRLGMSMTVSFGDGRGNLDLWFMQPQFGNALMDVSAL